MNGEDSGGNNALSESFLCAHEKVSSDKEIRNLCAHYNDWINFFT